MNTEELLKQRGSTHGDFTENSRISQGIKTVIRTGINWEQLPDYHKEALEMIAHKIGRWLSGDYMYDDNPKDIAGYSTLVVERIVKKILELDSRNTD